MDLLYIKTRCNALSFVFILSVRIPLSHPLASPMDVLVVLIEKYKDEHMPEITPIWYIDS